MGHGKGWNIEENEVLARAWIATSEDPIHGVNQKGKRFAEEIFRRFCELGPESSKTMEGRYRMRTPSSCKRHFDEMSRDCQKFGSALRQVRASNPTGCTEDNVFSMAVACHLGRVSAMDYKYKEYCKDNWQYWGAWTILRTRTKWGAFISNSSGSGNGDLTAELLLTKQGTSTDPVNASTSSSQDNLSKDEETAKPVEYSSSKKSSLRFDIGTKKAKQLNQESLRTAAVQSMAASAKRKSDALEERNAIEAFSRRDAADLPETAAFFKALREIHLQKALKRARLVSNDSDERCQD